MTDSPDKPRRAAKGRTKRVDDEVIAAALNHSKLHRVSLEDAAKKFGVSERTLRRAKARIKADPKAELAVLVSDQKQQAIERTKDLLTETFELGLRVLQHQLNEALKDDPLELELTVDDGPNGHRAKKAKRRITPREVIGAVKILGELGMTRNVLGEGDDDDDGEQPGTDREGQGSQTASRRAATREGGAAGAPTRIIDVDGAEVKH